MIKKPGNENFLFVLYLCIVYSSRVVSFTSPWIITLTLETDMPNSIPFIDIEIAKLEDAMHKALSTHLDSHCTVH